MELQSSIFDQNQDYLDLTYFKCKKNHEEVRWTSAIGDRCWFCDASGEDIDILLPFTFGRYTS